MIIAGVWHSKLYLRKSILKTHCRTTIVMYNFFTVSKPKVRKVERCVTIHTPKCSKDEVLRSQTYQQFMRNMEQIIELLDDTEPPNFESGICKRI